MYPKPVQDLAGWNITSIGVANTSIVISADDSLISWGASPTYGELVSKISCNLPSHGLTKCTIHLDSILEF